MSANEFNCPKCGGVVSIGADEDLTTHCPYCNSLIEIPEKFRRNPRAVVSSIMDEFQEIGTTQVQSSRKTAIVIVSIVVLFLVGLFVFIGILSSRNSAEPVNENSFVEVAVETTESATITPTLAFAYSVKTFGGSGNGEGLFNNPRYIDTDGLGNIYVADYDNGRIQRFDSDGVYQDGWSASDTGELIYGMAVNYDGMVFVAVGRNLRKYNGPTGQFISSFEAYGGGEYGDLTTTIDGDLLAVWYEGRNGFYDSDDPGHRVDLVMFDRDLNVMYTKQAFISLLTNKTQTEVLITVDGNGMIYAESDSTIFVFVGLSLESNDMIT